ncbi:MAG: LamG-like jellyroll fold domain-containing protein [Polyangiales bacterium]
MQDERADEPVFLGAGMPVLPIRRADGGVVALPASAPTSQPGAAGAVSAPAPGSTPVTPSTPDAGNAGSADTVPDEPEDAGTPEPPLTPIHRYDFAGTGDVATDLIGGADGRLRDGARFEGGGVVLDGADDYVELPPGLLSNLTDVTLLIWLRWDGGQCWQRVFDIGHRRQDPRDGSVLVAPALYLTLRSCPEDVPTLGYFASPGQVQHVRASEPARVGEQAQLGFRYDARTRQLALIADGAVTAERPLTLQLEAVGNASAWLGRSLFPDDPALDGRLEELRIYDRALDARELQRVFEAGPDQL